MQHIDALKQWFEAMYIQYNEMTSAGVAGYAPENMLGVVNLNSKSDNVWPEVQDDPIKDFGVISESSRVREMMDESDVPFTAEKLYPQSDDSIYSFTLTHPQHGRLTYDVVFEYHDTPKDFSGKKLHKKLKPYYGNQTPILIEVTFSIIAAFDSPELDEEIRGDPYKATNLGNATTVFATIKNIIRTELERITEMGKQYIVVLVSKKGEKARARLYELFARRFSSLIPGAQYVHAQEHLFDPSLSQYDTVQHFIVGPSNT